MEKPWKVVVAFVGVFIAGAVFGGFFALRVNQRDMRPRFSQAIVSSAPAPVGQTQAPSSGNRPKTPLPQLQLPAAMAVQAPQLMRRYVERLDLTAEQKEKINPLLVRAAADIRRQQQTNLQETAIIIQHLQEDLAKELTPVQRVRLEEMTENQRQIVEQRERQQAEKPRNQSGQKPAFKDGVKSKKGTGKPVDEGN
ncbi:MAG: hypothetical protein EXS40_08465 [Opitutaceae bacterium]|nr:hypothetical protein [Opitutaceae bacterium]